MKALLGRKIGMSQVFADGGKAIPVTLIVAEPNKALIHRTEDKDGYAAVQLALPRKKNVKQDEKKLTPTVLKAAYAARREFKGEFSVDQTDFTVAQFEPGDVVEVAGMSKGKGYAGVVKRHHFKGGPASHGHRHVLRRPGSIGGRFPQHVFKGMRMAGRMGYDRVTVKNLVVVAVDVEKNLIAIKGAVPGTKGSVLEIRHIEA
ncbi:MAG: 50S ribosomal protein L3 [Candidatus Andersenbacteria bacterium]